MGSFLVPWPEGGLEREKVDRLLEGWPVSGVSWSPVRRLYQRLAAFRFRVSVLTPQPFERLLRVAVDPVVGCMNRPPVPSRSCWLFLPGSGEPCPASTYTLRRLYAEACVAVEERASQWVERALREEAARLQADLAQVDAYYAKLAEEAQQPLGELLHRMAVAQVYGRLSRTPDGASRHQARYRELENRLQEVREHCARRLEELESERQQRRLELERSRAPTVRAELVEAAWLWVPRLEVQLGWDAPGAGSALLLVDLLCGGPVGLECGRCGARARQLKELRPLPGALACEACRREGPFAPSGEVGKHRTAAKA